MQVEEREIVDLKGADYNPRKLNKKQQRNLRESLEEFGMVDPVIVNMGKGRENILVGGHQRMKIWSDMGNKTIPCIEVDLTYEKEKELNLRLNKNTGEFNYEMVVELFNFDQLIDMGFSEKELGDQLSEFEEKFSEVDIEEPTYPIVPKFNESYNNVMIFCDGELDYTWLKNVLKLEKKKCYKSKKIGECAVIGVKEFQKIWKENETKNS